MKSFAFVRLFAVTATLVVVASGNSAALQAQAPAKGAPAASSVPGPAKYTDPIFKPVESTSATNPFEMLLPSLNLSIFRWFSL